MKLGRPAPRGPDREYALILALAVVIGALALVAVLDPPGRRGSQPAAASTSTIAVPGPVIGTKTVSAARPALTAGEVAAAREAARRFLTSYLPVLYGRRPPATLVDADTHVRAELATATRTPPAPRNRRPHLAALTDKPQPDGTVVVIATIADRVDPAYRIVFTLGQQLGGGWRVTELANY